MPEDFAVAPSAPAPSSASTAPAAAAPASTTPDVKKPASFRDALFAAEKEASSASADPAAGSPDAAAATVLPTDAGSPANRGPIPYERFSEVNTRMQAAEARSKELESHAWAKGLDQATVRDIVQWRVKSQTDLPAFLKELIDTAPADKLAQLRSELARQLGTRPAVTTPEQEPQPDLQTDTGAPVYSAKQQTAWMAWRDARQQTDLQAAIDKQLAPLVAEVNRGKQERDVVQSKARAQTFAQAQMKDAAEWPGFKEHAPAIAKELETFPLAQSEAEERLALHEAWMRVYRRDVLPQLSKTEKDRAIAEMQTKAAAGSAHPGRTATAPNPNKPKSFGEAIRREAEKAGWR